MQLAVSLDETQLWLDLQWVPREDNVLADALTIRDFSSFSADNRVEARVDSDTFPTLFQMVSEAKALFDALQQSKANAREPREWTRIPKNKKLKAADPW